MIIRDRLGKGQEIRHTHGGRGITSFYRYFEGKIDPSTVFADIMGEVAAYVGHHRHKEAQEILYTVSGQAEVFQGGERCILEPGDALLMKSGQSHVIRSIGD